MDIGLFTNECSDSVDGKKIEIVAESDSESSEKLNK